MPKETIPEDAIAELFAQLTGVQCVWAERKTPQLGATGGVRAWVELAVTSLVTVGFDEYRAAPNPNNPLAYVVDVSGYLKFTVQCRAKSQDAEVRPYNLLERLRWRLGSFTAAAFYRTTNCAWVDNSAISVFRGTAGGTRARLDANMDVILATVTGGVAKDDPGVTIGTVNSGGGIPFTGE